MDMAAITAKGDGQDAGNGNGQGKGNAATTAHRGGSAEIGSGVRRPWTAMCVAGRAETWRPRSGPDGGGQPMQRQTPAEPQRGSRARSRSRHGPGRPRASSWVARARRGCGPSQRMTSSREYRSKNAAASTALFAEPGRGQRAGSAVTGNAPEHMSTRDHSPGHAPSARDQLSHRTAPHRTLCDQPSFGVSSPGQTRGLEGQVAALGQAGRAPCRLEVVGRRRAGVAGQFAQVRPGGDQPVVPGHPLVRLERRDGL